MKIALGNDHHGVEVKNKIMTYLDSRGISYINYGSDTKENVDYILYASKVCKSIQNKECDLGILVCGTGIGMSIIANKYKGIRCGKVNTIEEAMLTKSHNMANIMSLSEKVENLYEILDNFIDTKYSNEERHVKRIEQIKEVENNG